MDYRGWIATMTLAAGLCVLMAPAQAFDESKYPDWKGKWQRPTGERPVWVRPGDKAPLTPEYQAIFEANLADQAEGGQGTDGTFTCLATGMPRTMMSYGPMEIVITPDVTYILIEYIHDNRRVFTDGRDWPTQLEPAFEGYSIGRWIDADGDGRYDTLQVETRGFRGPRAYDATGLPLHFDNQSVFMERIHRDKADPNILHDEITVIDHALTRPWSVDKKYVRNPSPRVEWNEAYCNAEDTALIAIGKEYYYKSADGRLMPTKKDQAPPDLGYFKQPQK